MAELPAGRERLREMADEGTDENVELAHYQLALAGQGGS
jgi:hypothetical protein